jgi:hypothetical protein
MAILTVVQPLNDPLHSTRVLFIIVAPGLTQADTRTHRPE